MTENRIHIGSLEPRDVLLLKDVASSAADEAVKKWLIAMGLDPNDPIGTQGIFSVLRDMANDESKLDRAWTRRTRGYWEGSVGKAAITVLMIAVYGAGQSAWNTASALVRAGMTSPHN